MVTLQQPQARSYGVSPASIQPLMAKSAILIVSTHVIHVNTRLTTHLPDPQGWKAELADPQLTVYSQSGHLSTMD